MAEQDDQTDLPDSSRITGSRIDVAIVTGGAQGIGKGIAIRLLRDGIRVAIADLDAEAGRETEAELAALGEVWFCQADVGREEDVVRLVNETVTRFGGLRVLVNNAGGGHTTPLTALTLQHWEALLRNNLTSAFLCSKYAMPFLREAHGAIVNIASTRALMAEPGNEAYSAAKGGVISLTRALAMSLAPDVRVNAISPGWIDVSGWKKSSQRRQQPLSPQDHEQHPAGRVGTPEDVAAAVAYLISDDAGFLTGQNLVLDGGMSRKMIYV